MKCMKWVIKPRTWVSSMKFINMPQKYLNRKLGRLLGFMNVMLYTNEPKTLYRVIRHTISHGLVIMGIGLNSQQAKLKFRPKGPEQTWRRSQGSRQWKKPSSTMELKPSSCCGRNLLQWDQQGPCIWVYPMIRTPAAPPWSKHSHYCHRNLSQKIWSFPVQFPLESSLQT